MFAVSKYIMINNNIEEINDINSSKINSIVQKLNNERSRVLLLAYRIIEEENIDKFSESAENNMFIIGILSFLDPPKLSSVTAINQLNKYGVEVKILTGDNVLVTRYIASEVGLEVKGILNGHEIESMSDDLLAKQVEITSIFAKLSPEQKARVIKILRNNWNTIGYMGDGINDSLAMKEADVAISVDTAVDIAKESADITLIEKDLSILMDGVIGGRVIFTNIIKYLKMSVSQILETCFQFY